MLRTGKKMRPYVKKSSSLKKILRKIDEVFHNIILDDEAAQLGLEVIVEDSVSKDSWSFGSINKYIHKLSTRGDYSGECKSAVAFQSIYYTIKWVSDSSLAESYAQEISSRLEPLKYNSEVRSNKISINAAVTKAEIIKSIEEYIQGKKGWLTKDEFIELTEASDHNLVECFGEEHDTIANQFYFTDDVVRFSKEFFKRSVPKDGGLKGVSYDTVYNHNANILNIYIKALKPRKTKVVVTPSLFA